MNAVKLTCCVVILALIAGCTSLQNLGGQVRAKVEPVVTEGQKISIQAEAYAVNANSIAVRIAEGQEVSRDEKQALADFTLALSATTTDIRQIFDYIMLMVKALPEPKR